MIFAVFDPWLPVMATNVEYLMSLVCCYLFFSRAPVDKPEILS